MPTIRLNRKCSKVVGISLDIFGNVRKSLKILGGGSDVFGIPVMTRQNLTPLTQKKLAGIICLYL